MSLVPGFQQDVFLSYAHVDDVPIPGCAEGWVTTLVRNLQWRMAQLCGRRDTFELWMDHDLARHVDFSPQILRTLHDSAVLVVVLSPGYLASDWCRRERDTFLNEVQRRRDRGPSVFLVERDRVPLERRPAEFSGLLGYEFWESRDGRTPRILGYPNPSGAYFEKLDDLARGLYDELLRLQRQQGPHLPTPIEPGHGAGAAPPAAANGRRVVFLAEVTPPGMIN